MNSSASAVLKAETLTLDGIGSVLAVSLRPPGVPITGLELEKVVSSMTVVGKR